MLSNFPPRFHAPRTPSQMPIAAARIVERADQQDGRPQAVDDQVADRHAVAQRDAEVTGQRVLEEREELLRQGLVQPVGPVELLELLRAGEPSAAQGARGVARQHAEQEEADDQHEGEAAERPEAAAEHVPAVRAVPVRPQPFCPGVRPGRRRPGPVRSLAVVHGRATAHQHEATRHHGQSGGHADPDHRAGAETTVVTSLRTTRPSRRCPWPRPARSRRRRSHRPRRPAAR